MSPIMANGKLLEISKLSLTRCYYTPSLFCGEKMHVEKAHCFQSAIWVQRRNPRMDVFHRFLYNVHTNLLSAGVCGNAVKAHHI